MEHGLLKMILIVQSNRWHKCRTATVLMWCSWISVLRQVWRQKVCVKIINIPLLCMYCTMFVILFIMPDKLITPHLSLIFSNVTVAWHKYLILTEYSNTHTRINTQNYCTSVKVTLPTFNSSLATCKMYAVCHWIILLSLQKSQRFTPT